MGCNGNYPPGAQYDPEAPYNQTEPPIVPTKVTVSVCYSRDLTIDAPKGSTQDELEAIIRETGLLPKDVLLELCRVLKLDDIYLTTSDWVEDDFAVID